MAPLPTPAGRQADVIYLDADRDQVVLGTAGSGKTVMAVHRAVHLSDPQYGHSGKTLLVTYNKALVSYLDYLVAGHQTQLDVRHYHHVARGYLASRGLMGRRDVSDRNVRKAYLREAIAEVAATYPGTPRFFRRPLQFFEDELDWISGHGYGAEASYLAAERRGRVTSLNPASREAILKVRESYLRRRAEGGQRYDWWDMPTALIAALEDDASPRIYKHIVVDEAQDLPPEAIRSLVKMMQVGGGITLFADYAQQLYGQRTSWEASGLRIIRPEMFKENYRNSEGIARLAIAISELPHFTDSVDLVVPTAPTVTGTPPTLFRAQTFQEEVSVVRAQATQFSTTGSVAILAHTHALGRSYAFGLGGRELTDQTAWTGGPGVYYGTYHSAKGLEFDAVIMPGLSATALPDSSTVTALGLDEAKEREARLLYVGVTRARSELLGTYVGEFTDLLPAPDSGLWLHTQASS